MRQVYKMLGFLPKQMAPTLIIKKDDSGFLLLFCNFEIIETLNYLM
jgi:hypothetical protein